LYIDATVQRVCNAEGRPVGFLCIIRNVTQNVMLQRNLEELSITDELTGLYNQRHFFGVLAEERERSRRFHRTFSLCFFDLDGFKSFNDSQGHLRGDDALKEAAELMGSLVRANVDTCFRYGGDEFTIIMPETSQQNALIVVERIRAGLCEHFQGDITASIGIAEFSSAMKPDDLVDKADRAMYAAKSRGGNRIVLAA
jgi:diguanylate cyclase (GGDEF)-like protein